MVETHCNARCRSRGAQSSPSARQPKSRASPGGTCASHRSPAFTSAPAQAEIIPGNLDRASTRSLTALTQPPSPDASRAFHWSITSASPGSAVFPAADSARSAAARTSACATAAAGIATALSLGPLAVPGIATGVVVTAGGALGARVGCELLIVLFKINESMETVSQRL